MLGSVVDDKLAAVDPIMRRYWRLRCLLRDYYRIIQLQCNIRDLIVQQNHVSGMTTRKKQPALKGRPGTMRWRRVYG
jgi:hypothetical protein